MPSLRHLLHLVLRPQCKADKQTGSAKQNMSSLDSMAGWAASSALIGFTLLPLTVLLAVKLRRNAKPHAQAARLAHILIQVALPVSAV